MEIIEILTVIEQNQHTHKGEIMAALDALTQAVADLTSQPASEAAAVTAALTDLQAEVANLQAAGVDTTALAAAVTQLQSVTSGEAATQAAATAADPGAQPAPAAAATPPTTA